MPLFSLLFIVLLFYLNTDFLSGKSNSKLQNITNSFSLHFCIISLYIFSRSNSSIGRFLCILRNLPASSHLYCSAELSCLAQSIMVRSDTPTLPPVVYTSSSISTPTNICIVISSYAHYAYSSAIYQSRLIYCG